MQVCREQEKQSNAYKQAQDPQDSNDWAHASMTFGLQTMKCREEPKARHTQQTMNNPTTMSRESNGPKAMSSGSRCETIT